MGSAAICGVNMAQLGTVGSSTQEVLLPVTNLLNGNTEQRWRSKTAADFFVCDLGITRFVDSIIVKGLTASVNAQLRIRISMVDSSGAAGEIYDSGVITNGTSEKFDINYATVACLLPGLVSARFVRVDISDPGASYVEAGKLFIGARTAFTYNFSAGWSVQWIDRSTAQESRGGQMLIWRDNKYRQLQIDFKWITTTQRYSVIEAIDRDAGTHADVLIITDTASANLARDCFLGLISESTPIVQPDPVFAPDGPLFSKSYHLRERL